MRVWAMNLRLMKSSVDALCHVLLDGMLPLLLKCEYTLILWPQLFVRLIYLGIPIVSDWKTCLSMYTPARQWLARSAFGPPQQAARATPGT